MLTNKSTSFLLPFPVRRPLKGGGWKKFPFPCKRGIGCSGCKLIFDFHYNLKAKRDSDGLSRKFSYNIGSTHLTFFSLTIFSPYFILTFQKIIHTAVKFTIAVKLLMHGNLLAVPQERRMIVKNIRLLYLVLLSMIFIFGSSVYALADEPCLRISPSTGIRPRMSEPLRPIDLTSLPQHPFYD